MGNGMNKVLPGLYVGNYRDSKDPQQLDKYQISHIVAIHDSPRRLLPDKHYLCVMAADTPDQNLSQYFSVCNDFIHAARLRDGNVLIHCLAGMSRSVTVAVAYIMTATNLSWKDALKVVRAGRAVANPNDGFQSQLQEFETYRLAEERRRLRERFPSSHLEQLDRTKCSTALDNYEELLQNRNICEGNCSRGEKCPTGVCNIDPSKGLFRRRPSSSSTRSRLRPQSAATSATAKSCPPSPKHSPGQRLSIGEQKIPEDEEAYLHPSTSSSASAAAASSSNLSSNSLSYHKQQQQQQQQHQQQQQQQQSQYKQTLQPTAYNQKSSNNGQQKSRNHQHQSNNQSRTGSIGSKDASDKHSNGSNLHRSASTVSGLAIRPRSSPAGLHSYTGSVPSSVHGSRVDLDNSDKGSAIYLGCSAPKNSSSMWSLSSRGSTNYGSAPPSPVHNPPKRTSSVVVRKGR